MAIKCHVNEVKRVEKNLGGAERLRKKRVVKNEGVGFRLREGERSTFELFCFVYLKIKGK